MDWLCNVRERSQGQLPTFGFWDRGINKLYITELRNIWGGGYWLGIKNIFLVKVTLKCLLDNQVEDVKEAIGYLNLEYQREVWIGSQLVHTCV